jgi:hypothetical protein
LLSPLISCPGLMQPEGTGAHGQPLPGRMGATASGPALSGPHGTEVAESSQSCPALHEAGWSRPAATQMGPFKKPLQLELAAHNREHMPNTGRLWSSHNNGAILRACKHLLHMAQSSPHIHCPHHHQHSMHTPVRVLQSLHNVPAPGSRPHPDPAEALQRLGGPPGMR